jgi:cyanophycinase-like exopeptidase
VSTLLLLRRSASFDPFVVQTIAKAEALFIAGGNQTQYVDYWQNTPVTEGINALARSGVPIGGTSAGNAMLGQFAFSALIGTILSPQVLRDPFNARLTIDNGFLSLSPLLVNTISDDHFVTRDRMGRMVAFLARISHDNNGIRPFGIALDEHTAFLMEANGVGQIVGSSTAYFISTPGVPEVCLPATPLTYQNLNVYRVSRDNTFDIVGWRGTGGTAYQLSAVNGKLTSTQIGGGIY